MSVVALAVVSFFAWLASTLAGGGSPFVLMPLVNFMLGAAAVPPVITLGMLVGNAHRIFLFWKDIDWKLTLWYAPGAVLGAVLGAYAYTRIHLDWLQLLIGLFLVVSMISLGFEQKEPTFEVKAWYIMPAAVLKAFFSGLIGTTGPILNPFYLSYGLVKEQLVATKSTHVVIIHTIKMLTYGFLGALSLKTLQAGLVIGLAAIPANVLGRYLLAQMNGQQFRMLVLSTMAISGLWMLWNSTY
jgi:hypothetical protein